MLTRVRQTNKQANTISTLITHTYIKITQKTKTLKKTLTGPTEPSRRPRRPGAPQVHRGHPRSPTTSHRAFTGCPTTMACQKGHGGGHGMSGPPCTSRSVLEPRTTIFTRSVTHSRPHLTHPKQDLKYYKGALMAAHSNKINITTDLKNNESQPDSQNRHRRA